MEAELTSTEGPRCPGCVERDRRIAELEARNAEFEARAKTLEARVKQLERIVGGLQRGAKRQAAPFSKGPAKAEPKKPGRKAGDEYGTTAFRVAPPVIDEQHEAPMPEHCPNCGGSDLIFERTVHQHQTEIPTRAIHRRFNIAVGRCACCRRRVRGRHPLQTSDAAGCCASQLGADAQALLVHLNKRAGLSHGKITELLKTCFGIDLSRGGACRAMQRAARRCEGEYGRIAEHIRGSPSVTPDETGWRIGGSSAWLHAAVTKDAAVYLVHRRRGFEAAKLLLGEGFAGTLIHDGWAAYERFTDAMHQTCLAHLLRRCHEMLETAVGGAVVLPRKITAILQQALAVRDRRDAGLILPATAARAAGRLQKQIVKLTETIKTNAANERLAAHVFRQRNHLFTFLRREGIEATNWRAEQALRPAVVNRKVWGGNRTERGAEAQGILMTIWQTARLRGVDPMHWLSRRLRSPDATPTLITAPNA